MSEPAKRNVESWSRISSSDNRWLGSSDKFALTKLKSEPENNALLFSSTH